MNDSSTDVDWSVSNGEHHEHGAIQEQGIVHPSHEVGVN